ncbi:phospholipase C, phosphocholine-specific [Jatrophihabitans sp.]|uniref:phosphocholine-specific phospholipase C n=1 Tax=Jatrophihabitans sp. TaxID=1932789 RepID=UPI0030C77C8B|nr:plcC [Jatrophihabitans sp.]
MPNVDRRRFLQLAGGATALSMLPTSIARAAAIPANRRYGDLRDVEHIVVLMQENRSFDHYFGTLRGVRGFGDPHPPILPSGRSSFHQTDGTTETLPFRPSAVDLGLSFLEGSGHSWGDQHEAFNNGRYDQWIPAKGTTVTMAHLDRKAIPFHYALADAFTICDSYHCSILSSTDPNRYYMWTGWVGNDGKGGGPVIGNDEIGYSWTTYPERLQAAGVSWKIYQDIGVGLDAAGYWGWTSDHYIGNFGDNSLLYFKQFQDSKPGSPLYKKALTGTDVSAGQSFFADLLADVKNDRLPQISWIVAPEAYTEHPNWPPNFGAWYVSNVLDALTSNPEVWSKTALLLTYDENDGYFDHIVPAYPNVGPLAGGSTVSTANELYPGQGTTPGGSTGEVNAYGLGVRVPMLAISPWSTGGWVCSQTFDHTSILQFMERRFGVKEPNITPWRRAVAGDLTSAFDFSKEESSRPKLPSTTAYRPKGEPPYEDYAPTPPAKGTIPKQEPGTRPSRALGYRFDVTASLQAKELRLKLNNPGKLGVALHVRSNRPGTTMAPECYTLGAGTSLTATVPVHGAYDISVHGPNGYFRRYADGTDYADLTVYSATEKDGSLSLALSNTGTGPLHLRVTDVYSGVKAVTLLRGASQTVSIAAHRAGGWYDVGVSINGSDAFVRRFAGRVETGKPSISDPQLG